jgi:hypothetical protein
MVINLAMRERERILIMIDEYNAILDSLPKGTLLCKKSYMYLQYRNGKKIISDYIGKDPEKIENINQNLERRKHIEKMVAFLQNELELTEKITEGF